MRPISKIAVPFALLLLATTTLPAAEPGWKVHEWGTFTSLQDETGAAIGGINTDDEPVPDFVHQLAHPFLLFPTEIPVVFFQGSPACHPDVTMRLETPVLYFYPPAAGKVFEGIDVRVKFRGGWLTEFFPNAETNMPGLPIRGRPGRVAGPLRSDTVGYLGWKNLKVGGDWPGPETASHVWVSPRAVKSASVQNITGESEKFLFYRGVGHIDAPLKIVRDSKTDRLIFRSQLSSELSARGPLKIPSAWLVDIRPDGTAAFSLLPPLALDGNTGRELARISATFNPLAYSSYNLPKLKKALRQALVAEGLFADEAEALLNTWELSYFKSPGLRVFFIVPPAWTEFYLPLEMSPAADITRVMVGRVELVTPQQRKTLRKLAAFSPRVTHLEAEELRARFYARYPKDAGQRKHFDEVVAARRSLASYLPVPETYQTYLDLGRFRNALVLEEAKKSHSLTNFIAQYRLEAHKPVESSSNN